MSEAENNAKVDIWEEVYVGYSNGKENSSVLKKYPEEPRPTRVDNLIEIMFFFGVLFLVVSPGYFHFFKSIISHEDISQMVVHWSFVAFFLFSLGNAYGQRRIVGASPGYIKFHRRTTVGLWLYIIGCCCFNMKSDVGNLIFIACTGMAVLLFWNGHYCWQRHKYEIHKWKEVPEKIGLLPSREYIPYRFLIFEEGNNARLFEYRGNINKPGLVYKFPYEEKQANIKDEPELKTIACGTFN